MARHATFSSLPWFGWQGRLAEGDLEWVIWSGDDHGGSLTY